MKRLCLLLVSLTLFLGGCERVPGEQSLSFFAMDTYMDLRIIGGDEALLASLKKKTEELETLFSVTRSDSEIARLNREGRVRPSANTEAILKKALALCERSGGALDITVYPALLAWGFTGGSFQVLSPAESRELAAKTDYKKLVFTEKGLELPGDMAVDLGAVAKGYTADVLAEMLRAAGVEQALLDLGGNILALGTKADGSPWQIGLRNPAGEGIIGRLSARDEAVVTSGSYERSFQDDTGRSYGHILDPASGRPVENSLLSVTVVGREGLLCDGLSTALFVMGEEGAIAHWRAFSDFEMILISEDGKMLISEGLQDRFQPGENCPYDKQIIKRNEN